MKPSRKKIENLKKEVIKKNKLCGIVTERDIVNTVANYKNNALEKKLKLFMTKKVIYININFKLINALEVLKLSGFRHLPIYDDQKLKFFSTVFPFFLGPRAFFGGQNRYRMTSDCILAA